MKEIMFLVLIFLINIFPFVSETFGGFFLMLPKSIEIGNSIYRFLPLHLDRLWQFVFPLPEEILMRLQEICFELSDKNARNAMNDGIPVFIVRENTRDDMIAGCLKCF